MKFIRSALAAAVISVASSGAMASVINVYDGMAAQTIFSGSQSLNGSPLEVGLNVIDTNGAQFIVGLVDTTDDKGSILYEIFNDSDVAETTFLAAGSAIFSETLLDKNLDGIDDSFTKFLSFGQYVLRLTNIAPGEKFGESQVSAVPLPAAAWLFGSAALGFFGFARRRKQADVAAV